MSPAALGACAGLLLGACLPRGEITHGDPETFPLRFSVIDEGTDTSSDMLSPAVFLTRTEREAEWAARRVGIEEVARILASWSDYQGRALIVILGRSQPDASLRVRVEEVRGPAFGSAVVVTAHTEGGAEPASVARSVPWTVVSVFAGDVAAADECRLDVDGVKGESRCPHKPVPP